MTTDSRPRGHEAARPDAPIGTADDDGCHQGNPADDHASSDDTTWGKALNDEEFSRAVRRVLGRVHARAG